MAMTKLIDASAAAVLEPAATIFSPSGPFIIDAVGLTAQESIVLYRLFSDGLYHPAFDSSGAISLSSVPNNILVQVPGSYKLVRPVSGGTITAGWGDA